MRYQTDNLIHSKAGISYLSTDGTLFAIRYPKELIVLIYLTC